MVSGLSDPEQSQEVSGMLFSRGSRKVNRGDNVQQIWENVDMADLAAYPIKEGNISQLFTPQPAV